MNNTFFFFPPLSLQIFSNLSLNERCLSASLVCKYWRDLCLDFQFWKQLDLSSRQQVWRHYRGRIVLGWLSICSQNLYFWLKANKRNPLSGSTCSFSEFHATAWKCQNPYINCFDCSFLWLSLNGMSTSAVWSGLWVTCLRSTSGSGSYIHKSHP